LTLSGKARISELKKVNFPMYEGPVRFARVKHPPFVIGVNILLVEGGGSPPSALVSLPVFWFATISVLRRATLKTRHLPYAWPLHSLTQKLISSTIVSLKPLHSS
jgi:hypothetical protein